MAERLLAIDLTGTIHGVALCEVPAGVSIGAPGWLIRSTPRHVHAWLAPADSGNAAGEACSQVRMGCRHWGLTPAAALVVPLMPAIHVDWIGLAAGLDVPRLWIPDDGHVISPRGIAPAVRVRDYARPMRPPARLDLPTIRRAFLTLIEQASDDVQAEGLEQDDAFFDRFADVRVSGHDPAALLPLENLTDPQWLLEQWTAAWLGAPASRLEPQSIEIHALRLRCAVGTPDHGFRANATPRAAPSPPVSTGWQVHRQGAGYLLSANPS